ncbi:MAG: NfeD family protein [Bacteroidales bacterium]|jgi:membrane-bound serine protease (ClpP class)|nr:NfeD family protein [Bacteroidales bacterium]
MKRTSTLLVLMLLGIFAFSQPDSLELTTLIYKFEIKEQIAPPAVRTTQRAFEEAKEAGADLMLIHMNTYGGMVDAADSIRTRILNSDIPVYVFIDNNAASAGALIAIACDSIYMAPVASIGAATVVDQSGQPVPDKYQSYMRSWMRATAEAKGRDPDIAQAMVDPDIYIQGIVDSGKVLTFTTSEAIEHGYCEGSVENIAELLDDAHIPRYEIITHKKTGTDKIIGWLINPIVSGILIMIIIGGIYFELQSPGIGFPLVASIIAALLYFAPLYIQGLADHWEIVIFIVGIILILVEVFAIPGFGVAGISGILLVVAGLTLSLVGNVGLNFSGVGVEAVASAFFIVIIAIFLALIGSFWISKKLFTSTIFGHLALDAEQHKEDGYTVSNVKYSSMLGKKGKAWSNLRPAGKVLIEGDVYDATAMTGYIEKGSDVEVVKYETGQLFVVKK